MRAEAAASYSRMRYGLATALMGDGLFAYDYGPDGHGDRWWYDEYGLPGGSASTQPATTTLPLPGYLGRAGGAPKVLDGVFHSVDQVSNGNFNLGLNNWIGWVDPNSDAAARFKFSETGGLEGTRAAQIIITDTYGADNVELRQSNKSTVKHRDYTVSFWGRSTQASHPIDVQLIVNPTSGGTGFHVQATLTPEWQFFRLTDESLYTRSDLRLVFQLGSQTGKIWLDNVQFQEGAAGAWARSFENGLAVINPGRVAQTVPLPGLYRKLNGSQAPLFQIRVDENNLQVNGSWVKSPANFSQFDGTVYTTTAPNPLATITYQPNLLYSGDYQVLAWVVPTVTQSSAVSVTIRHAQGVTTVILDETHGEVGWRNLGTYRFNKGDTGRVVLSATGTGLVVADAFKWISTARYNDGQDVTQLVLQPQDAIILQKPQWNEVFLPLLTRQVP
ncbi:Xanthan lyase [Thermoflexales bacterium]|nr:Xanthan lyase [Thermoflexales bacterium]